MNKSETLNKNPIIKSAFLLLSLLITVRGFSQSKGNETLIPYMDEQGKWGYLGAQSRQIIIPAKYDDAGLFDSEGRAEVAYETQAQNWEQRLLTGWIDGKGTEIFAPQFTGVYDVKKFSNDEIIPGYREVYTPDGKNGVLSLSGQWIIPLGNHERICFYDTAHYLLDDILFYASGQKYQAPAKSKITSVDFENHFFYLEGKDDLHNGLCRWDGTILAEPVYLNIDYHPQAKRFIATKIMGNPTLEMLMQKEAKLSIQLLDQEGRAIQSFTSDLMPDVINDSVISYEYQKEHFYVHLQDGQVIPEESYLANSEGSVIYAQNNLYGLKDAAGRLVIQANYPRLQLLDKTFLKATDPDSYLLGVLDLQGKEILPFVYRDIDYWPKDHLFIASKDDLYGVLDESGKPLVPFLYNNYFYFDDDRALVNQGGKNGVIDRSGKEIIPLQYDEIFNTHSVEKTPEVYFKISRGELWGLMDKNGKLLMPIRYGYLSFNPAMDPPDWVNTQDTAREHQGMYQLSTQLEIPPIYDIVRAYAGFIIVGTKKNNDYFYQLLNAEGHPLSDSTYTRMEYTRGYLSVKKGEKYGVLNVKGQVLIEPKYDYLWEKTDHLLLAQKGQKYVYIDIEGNEYTP